MAGGVAGNMRDRGHAWHGGMRSGEMATEAGSMYPTGMYTLYQPLIPQIIF